MVVVFNESADLTKCSRSYVLCPYLLLLIRLVSIWTQNEQNFMNKNLIKPITAMWVVGRDGGRKMFFFPRGFQIKQSLD